MCVILHNKRAKALLSFAGVPLPVITAPGLPTHLRTTVPSFSTTFNDMDSEVQQLVEMVHIFCVR